MKKFLTPKCSNILVTKKTPWCLMRPKKQASFDEIISLKWMRIERILENYCDKKLNLQVTSVSAYMHASKILKCDHASVLFSAADVELPGNVVYIVPSPPKPRSYFLAAKI